MRHGRIAKGHMLDLALGAVAVTALSAGTAAMAEQPNPYRMANNSWITLSGTVGSVSPDSFTLDYGDGVVIVEMDDGDRDADAYQLLPGDEVSVAGVIDDDFFELTTIEASSVYVKNIDTTFLASSVDEEDSDGWTTAVTVPIMPPETVIYGTVTDVDAHEFTVDSGIAELRVDVGGMAYNPLDDEGYQKVRVGDRVRVMGNIDIGFFEGRELEADSVTVLSSS